jgi:hypothetical protein
MQQGRHAANIAVGFGLQHHPKGMKRSAKRQPKRESGPSGSQ